LNQANADMLMERFVSDYPKSNQAFIEVAHYFDQGNYTQALQWFVNESQLSGKQR
jgi:type I site-specific restriction endonuclease